MCCWRMFKCNSHQRYISPPGKERTPYNSSVPHLLISDVTVWLLFSLLLWSRCYQSLSIDLLQAEKEKSRACLANQTVSTMYWRSVILSLSKNWLGQAYTKSKGRMPVFLVLSHLYSTFSSQRTPKVFTKHCRITCDWNSAPTEWNTRAV